MAKLIAQTRFQRITVSTLPTGWTSAHDGLPVRAVVEFSARATPEQMEILAVLFAELYALTGPTGVELAVGAEADVVDAARDATERDMNASLANAANAKLKAVLAAIGAMRDGSFGLCADCEAEVGVKRLRAVPWALRCRGCQEKFELEEELCVNSHHLS